MTTPNTGILKRARRPSPLVPMVVAQVVGFVLVVFGAWVGKQIGFKLPLGTLVTGQAVGAVGIGFALGLRGGWLLLQGGLPFLLWAFLALAVPSWVYLGVVAVLALITPNALFERVPLYLTNRPTWAALSKLIDTVQTQASSPRRFVDLGCGTGGTIAYLAQAHPDWHFVGVENAPGPYLVSKLRLWRQGNATVVWQSLWNTPLGKFDVAYAFLSPAPMARLIAQAGRDMRPGSLFVSNSFWAEDGPFDEQVLVSDKRKTKLFIKKI